MTRRQLAAGLAAVSGSLRPALAANLKGIKIGVTDWNLRMASKPEAVELAKRLGFAGVEVSLGRKVEDNKLPLDSPELLLRYREAFRANDFRPAGTCLDVLHVNYLKNDP